MYVPYYMLEPNSIFANMSVLVFLKENNLIKSEKAVGETPFSHVTSVVVAYFIHQGAPCSFCKHTNQLIWVEPDVNESLVVKVKRPYYEKVLSY